MQAGNTAEQLRIRSLCVTFLCVQYSAYALLRRYATGTRSTAKVSLAHIHAATYRCRGPTACPGLPSAPERSALAAWVPTQC